MSFTRKLLYSIADELGRSRQQMDRFIQVLEKNWFDSKSSLQSLAQKDYDRFGIPARLACIISEKVSENIKRPQNSMQMEVQFSIPHQLSILKKQLPTAKYDQIINVLMKIFANIRNNITQEKYRVLKRSNKKIGAVLEYKQVETILAYGGFEKEGRDLLVLKKIDLAKLDDCLDGISREHPDSKFDPYKSQMISLEGDRNLQILTQQKQSETAYNDKLAELEKEREKMMSRPVRDRDVKIYQVQKIKQSGRDNFMMDQKQLNEEEQFYMQSIKEFLKKQGEDPKFMNRRKQEYFQLLKKPCFSETLIRVKLPDNWVFECKFSPMENLEQLVKIFDQYVEDKKLDYYLYMTPPVQQLKGKIVKSTFYDLGCVPKAVFYFGSEISLNKNPLKTPNKGFFNFF